MGVYIKNMEMPKNCHACPIYRSYRCPILHRQIDRPLGSPPPSDCPLVSVPTPHGRLIDELMHEFEKAQRTMAQHGREYSCSFMSSSQEISTEWYCVEDMLENAPTIIEAEPAEEVET